MRVEETWGIRLKYKDGSEREYGSCYGRGPLDHAETFIWAGGNRNIAPDPTLESVTIEIIQFHIDYCSFHMGSGCPCAPYTRSTVASWDWNAE